MLVRTKPCRCRWSAVLHRLAVLLLFVGVFLFLGTASSGRTWAQGAGPTDIIISEVMFNAAIESSNQGEWIEVYNSGTTAVDVTGWVLQDNSATDTITSAMCPSGLCQVPAGGCWLIAVTPLDLQNEFDQYTNPAGLVVDVARTIFLGSKIGGGLANTGDGVALVYTSGEAVDCVSWGASTLCSGLTYYPGGNGQDTGISSVGNAQSIANIQGQWYKHEPNASPYNCTNTAAGGSPTAVTLSSFSARTLPVPWTAWTGVLVSLSILGVAVVVRRRTG